MFPVLFHIRASHKRIVSKNSSLHEGKEVWMRVRNSYMKCMLDRCFILFCNLKFSSIFISSKGNTFSALNTLSSDVSIASFISLSFSLSSLLSLEKSFCPLKIPCLCYFFIFLWLLYVARDVHITVSLLTPTCQLLPLPWQRSIVMATQAGWGEHEETEQDRMERNIKERQRERERKESRTSFLIKR